MFFFTSFLLYRYRLEGGKELDLISVDNTEIDFSVSEVEFKRTGDLTNIWEMRKRTMTVVSQIYLSD